MVIEMTSYKKGESQGGHEGKSIKINTNRIIFEK